MQGTDNVLTLEARRATVEGKSHGERALRPSDECAFTPEGSALYGRGLSPMERETYIKKRLDKFWELIHNPQRTNAPQEWWNTQTGLTQIA